MKVRQSVPLVFVLALSGCMKPNPLIYTLGDADEQAGSETGDGAAGEAESVLPDVPSGETSGEMCEPLEAFGADCGECLDLDCCELALACAELDECLCLADCMFAGGTPGSCKNECDVVSPSEIDELNPLLECATEACDQAC